MDTRVMQVTYSIERGSIPIKPDEEMDVYIDQPSLIAKRHRPPRHKVLVHFPFPSEGSVMNFMTRKASIPWSDDATAGALIRNLP